MSSALVIVRRSAGAERFGSKAGRGGAGKRPSGGLDGDALLNTELKAAVEGASRECARRAGGPAERNGVDERAPGLEERERLEAWERSEGLVVRAGEGDAMGLGATGDGVPVWAGPGTGAAAGVAEAAGGGGVPGGTNVW